MAFFILDGFLMGRKGFREKASGKRDSWGRGFREKGFREKASGKRDSWGRGFREKGFQGKGLPREALPLENGFRPSLF